MTDDAAPRQTALAGALKRLEPRRDALFEWLRPRLSDDRLLLIAGLDYGRHESEYHADLRGILATGRISPNDNPWTVVQLCLHECGNDDAPTALLAAAIDILSSAEIDGYGDVEAKALAILVSFALDSGPDAARSALCFVAGRMLSGRMRQPEPLFAALAATILAAAHPRPEDGDAVAELAAWLEEEEPRVRDRAEDRIVPPRFEPEWLIGLRPDATSNLPAWWRGAIRRTLAEPAGLTGASADAARRIAARFPDACAR